MDSRLACDEVEWEEVGQAVSRVSCRVGYHVFEMRGIGAPEHRLYAVVWSCCIIERRVRLLYGV